MRRYFDAILETEMLLRVVVEETDTLAAHGRSYVGTFTFKTYDVNGNFTGTEVKGTVAATRITLD